MLSTYLRVVEGNAFWLGDAEGLSLINPLTALRVLRDTTTKMAL